MREDRRMGSGMFEGTGKSKLGADDNLRFSPI
jgi:hypothetical protein